MICYYAKKFSIKADDFIEFLYSLREKTDETRVYMMLDNCSIHKTKKVKEKME